MTTYTTLHSTARYRRACCTDEYKPRQVHVESVQSPEIKKNHKALEPTTRTGVGFTNFVWGSKKDPG